MPLLISSFIPFPNILWWAVVGQYDTIMFDIAEHFEKMTYRNRYAIAGANGKIQLSIPLVCGRNQRTPMADVMIYNKENWQVQHWRTLVSVYRRSPYFEHYEHSLESLYNTPFEKLTDFNLASIQWLKKQLHLSFTEEVATRYEKHYAEGTTDIRSLKPAVEKKAMDNFPVYYQVFTERTGFLPNLSILDLLFSEGPYSMRWIHENRKQIVNL